MSKMMNFNAGGSSFDPVRCSREDLKAIPSTEVRLDDLASLLTIVYVFFSTCFPFICMVRTSPLTDCHRLLQVFIQRWPAPIGYKFFRNMMADVLTVAMCNICYRVRHDDPMVSHWLTVVSKRPSCLGCLM
jgi:hypothetical protein